ncbi:MAG: cysteine desulfurase [Proteobacteria bacterium SG_bin7]|nr:MAG: cysteine desulfurase [Proteobacteria bacterium SG_bin7]
MNKTKTVIYLDNNATTPPHERVLEKTFEWLKLWGNPSSIHGHGRGPKNLMREARRKISEMIVASNPLEVIFTSCGSESNNLVIRGTFDYFYKTNPKKNVLICSAIEHPSVIKTMKALEPRGAEVKIIPVSRSGEIDLAVYENMLNDKVALVSVMSASNESGVIFPIKKLAKIARQKEILFHTDAVQALGKIPLGVTHWDVDFASFAGHKVYALRGCGVVYAKRGTILESLITGGGQERGRRCGTENLLAIAALAEMSVEVKSVEAKKNKMEALRDYMENRILSEISDVEIIAQTAKRLPNTSCLIVSGVSGETLLMNLDLKNFSVSTGSACSAGNPEPSAALLAMGISHAEAQSSLRLSLGWNTTKEEIDLFVDALKDVVVRLRKIAQMRELENTL